MLQVLNTGSLLDHGKYRIEKVLGHGGCWNNLNCYNSLDYSETHLCTRIESINFCLIV